MSYSFDQMALHLNEHLKEIALSAPERQRVARIIGPSANWALEQCWNRYNCFLELRDMLVNLSPRESAVRALHVGLRASNSAQAA
jgi:hypothetical protein